MNGRMFAAALLVTMFAAHAARAQGPATRPADDPKQKIASLIADLAAEDFKVRDAANQELRRLGRAALPALNDALKSDDPSIKSYAEGLVAAINQDLNPPRHPTGRDEVVINRLQGLRPPPGLVRRGAVVHLNNARHTAVNVRIVNGVKDVTVTEDGRKITIHEVPAGDIEVTVTETKDGKEQTTRYKAGNAEELKKEHPEAHKLYEQYAGANAGGAVRIIERAGRLDLVPPPIVIPPAGLDFQKLRDEQRARMDEIMRRALLPDLQHRRIFQELDEAHRIQRQMLDEVRRELDKVRQEMRREIIPDLRGLLPPPADEDFEELEAPDDD